MANVESEIKSGHAVLGYMRDESTAVVLRQNGSYTDVPADKFAEWSQQSYTTTATDRPVPQLSGGKHTTSPVSNNRVSAAGPENVVIKVLAPFAAVAVACGLLSQTGLIRIFDDYNKHEPSPVVTKPTTQQNQQPDSDTGIFVAVCGGSGLLAAGGLALAAGDRKKRPEASSAKKKRK